MHDFATDNTRLEANWNSSQQMLELTSKNQVSVVQVDH